MIAGLKVVRCAKFAHELQKAVQRTVATKVIFALHNAHIDCYDCWVLLKSVTSGCNLPEVRVVDCNKIVVGIIDMLRKSLNCIIMGAPGGGKGTISKKLVKDFGFVHVSAPV
jgi:hypothetical protein